MRTQKFDLSGVRLQIEFSTQRNSVAYSGTPLFKLLI